MKGVFCTREVTRDIDGRAPSVLRMLERAFAGNRVFCLDQIHSDIILLAEDILPGDIPQADAIISRNVDDVLCVRTADCVPVLAWSDDVPLIAAIHAGWRGLASRIVEKTVRAMVSMGAKEVRASIGPAIGKCCYEVKEDVVQALGAVPEVNGQGSLFVDLWEAAASQLVDSGVKRDAIDIKGLCTACERERFFSYRSEGPDTGRNISVIGGRSWSLPGLQAG